MDDRFVAIRYNEQGCLGRSIYNIDADEEYRYVFTFITADGHHYVLPTHEVDDYKSLENFNSLEHLFNWLK